ncbi:alpha/beta hydrolase [Ideonella sp. YS5]|uniref:alpha/beta hydrolase n=1 Tax=Ideonella sp. YS5 TaxID=3453714 RepID=UPI003EEE9973
MRRDPTNTRLGRKLAAAGALAAMPALAAAADGWNEGCQCYRNMAWGAVEWFEPEVRQVLKQDLDYFPVARDQAPTPVIVYAHAAMTTKYIGLTQGTYLTMVQPARAAGMSVISVEYRHPVKDDYIVPPPHDDIAEAVRWIRGHAESLNLDADNVFLLGHSRGTLALWTALRYQRDTQVRVNAVYGYNAQITYRGNEMAERFLVEPDRAGFVADYEARHPQHELFGSAVAESGVANPPILLHYEYAFYRRLVTASEFTEHHPDSGLAMCHTLLLRTPSAPCTAVDQIPRGQAYDGVVDFFLQYVR